MLLACSCQEVKYYRGSPCRKFLKEKHQLFLTKLSSSYILLQRPIGPGCTMPTCAVQSKICTSWLIDSHFFNGQNLKKNKNLSSISTLSSHPLKNESKLVKGFRNMTLEGSGKQFSLVHPDHYKSDHHVRQSVTMTHN